MQRYVQQLINELETRAKARVEQLDANGGIFLDEPRPSGAPDDGYDELYGDMADHFRDVEAYLAGPTEGVTQSLAYYTDIDLAALPPPDKLTGEEAHALFEALNYLISTYGHTVDLDLAEDCPPQLPYGYMLKVLAEPTVMMMGGHSGHDCGTYAPDCEFGQYCGCLEYWLRDSFVEAGGDPDIPAERFPTEEQLRATHPEMMPGFEFGSRGDHASGGDGDDAHGGDDSGDAYDIEADYDAFIEAGETFFVAPDLRDSLKGVPFAKPEHITADLEALQSVVDYYIKTTGVRYFSELTNTAILAEEVGEVARLAARRFGEQSFKTPEAKASAKTEWADELSDVLFVLTCLANQTGVDLTEAFAKGMAKRNGRDKDRHRGNEKLGGR